MEVTLNIYDVVSGRRLASTPPHPRSPLYPPPPPLGLHAYYRNIRHRLPIVSSTPKL